MGVKKPKDPAAEPVTVKPIAPDVVPPREDLTTDGTGAVAAAPVSGPKRGRPAKGATRKAEARVRKKRPYVAKEKPDKEPPEPVAVSSPKQRLAGFGVAISLVHMAIATRVPEMALEHREAEQLSGAIDNLCTEFGYEPSSKAGAVLAFAGVAFMVYAPKIGAIQSRRKREKAQRSPPLAAVQPRPENAGPSIEDLETAALLARNTVAADNGGTSH